MINPTDVVSLDLMKQHLRVDHDAEDDLIMVYASSALSWCLWYLDNPEIETADDIPQNVKSAFLLVLGDLYNKRESQTTDGNLYQNQTAEYLLWASRNWRRTDVETNSQNSESKTFESVADSFINRVEGGG